MHASSRVATLLFTDIEGSTRLWEQDAEAMSRALAEHDALSRKVVESHRGAVVKMTGDGMYAAFDDPLDALNATAALQQGLDQLTTTQSVPLRVRAGLHLGIVERRSDDLFGSSVNRAARIMQAAHGGQILLSQAVCDEVRDRLPPPVSLQDLGAVRLRDLTASEHVYQLVHPLLRLDFPALRSLEATPNNLPQQVTSFIGRERELAEAERLVARTRLLTLFGMGGMGKTRLVLQIAADMLETYPDGVWFVDLAPINDPALVPNVTAHVLGVREEPGRSVTDALCAHLADRTLLLILDNCEHLVGACAKLADRLLAATKEIRILATSREALHIRGEQVYPVVPLRLPDGKADAEALLRSEAVQLFVERARLQKPAFSISEREVPAVAELCARLDGIPLALELAAARLRSLSLTDINARLNDRFRLLTTGSRVALERQQTLRALVSWSYDLLRPDEQIVLDRLSVFYGGFDIGAAEVICGASPIAPEDVLDLVNSLVEKSLVVVEPETDGASRYGVLETIKDFAHDRLAHRVGAVDEPSNEAPNKRNELAATLARHCAHYFSVARTAGVEKLQGPEQAVAMRRLETDLGNLRAAIALALAGTVDPVFAVKIEVALMRFRTLRGYSTEGRNNIRAALALPALEGATKARAFALYTGGGLATNQGDHAEATKMLTECLAIRRELGNRTEVAGVLSTLALVQLQTGDTAKARQYQEESLAVFREVGNELGEAIGLQNLGEIVTRQSDFDGARRLFEQSLAIARRIKHQELESECERNLGELEFREGNLSAARVRFQRSLKVSQDAEDKRGEAITLWRLGAIDKAHGELDSARRKLARAIHALQSFEMNAEVLDCLEDYAGLLQQAGAQDDTVRAMSAIAAARKTFRLSRSTRRDDTETQLNAARVSLGEPTFLEAWSIGQTWSLDELVHYIVAPPSPSGPDLR